MRVAIVNDVRLATEALKQIVLSSPDHRIAWTAADGLEALGRCREDTPDVVLMDLVMPVMNGAEATRRIMQECPCPVLVVTSTIAGHYSLVCEALGHGAYDAVRTPALGNAPPALAGAQLLAKLANVDRVQQQMGSDVRPVPAEDVGPPRPAVGERPLVPLVAIGASTGGPQALETILSRWPSGFPAGVVVVQHIAPDFAPSLVQWLSERCRLHVRTALPGDVPQPGTVLIAATNDHMVMTRGGKLVYTRDPVDSPYRPSVDAFFHSLADHRPPRSVAVLLTGIGRDGAKGLLKLRRAGWHTIAQDRGSSVVYGMPQAAAAIDAAVRTLPVGEIAGHVARHLSHGAAAANSGS